MFLLIKHGFVTMNFVFKRCASVFWLCVLTWLFLILIGATGLAAIKQDNIQILKVSVYEHQYVLKIVFRIYKFDPSNRPICLGELEE